MLWYCVCLCVCYVFAVNLLVMYVVMLQIPTTAQMAAREKRIQQLSERINKSVEEVGFVFAIDLHIFLILINLVITTVYILQCTLLKSYANVFARVITTLANMLLQLGKFLPVTRKLKWYHCWRSPDYRPILNLSTVFQVIKRLVLSGFGSIVE